MKARPYIFLFMCIVIFYTGCISFKSHLGGIQCSSERITGRNYEVLGEGEGQSSSFHLFWCIRITPKADLNKAVRNAVASRGGNSLINLRWRKEKKVYILGTVTVIHVKGTVIRYTSGNNP